MKENPIFLLITRTGTLQADMLLVLCTDPGIHGVMVTIGGNGHGETSSNL